MPLPLPPFGASKRLQLAALALTAPLALTALRDHTVLQVLTAPLAHTVLRVLQVHTALQAQAVHPVHMGVQGQGQAINLTDLNHWGNRPCRYAFLMP